MIGLSQLRGIKGDVREKLNLPPGIIEWSNRRDWATLAVLNGLWFRDFVVKAVAARLDMVQCRFDGCAFLDLKSDAHFWAAKDLWNDCVFERCCLKRMISPMNTFAGCRFTEVEISRYDPFQTLFDGCQFQDCRIFSVRCSPIYNRQNFNPDLKAVRGHLVFRNCRFERVRFEASYFAEVVFENCSFDGVAANACDFSGIRSDFEWWSPQISSPFLEFLQQALDLILRTCGEGSSAYQEFSSYYAAYSSGRTTDKNFSNCLYDAKVPYEETEKFIEELLLLTERFPM